MRANKILKFLDFYIGIFLVYTLGVFRKKIKTPPKNIKSIGILKPVALGDLTLVSAVLQDLKEGYPKSEIIAFIGKDNAILADHLPDITKYVILNVKNPIKALKLIRKHKLDVLIDFCSWPRINALICFFSKAKWTIGFKTKGQKRHYTYHHYVEHRSDIHELDNYRRLTKPLKVQSNNYPKLLIKDLLIKDLESKKYCVFHLCAAGSNKNHRQWPLENWREVFLHLDRMDIDVYLTGSAFDYTLNYRFVNLCDKPKKLHNIANKFSFSQSLSIISKAKAVVSVNTGIMHIAAAIGVKVIGINGPTNMNRWGGIGKNVFNIAPNIKECGFLNLGFEKPKTNIDCMSFVSPNVVIEKLNVILKK